MSNAIVYKPFGELLKKVVDNRGRTCPNAETGIPLIATNCIKNENLYPVFEKVRYVSQEIFDTWFRGHPEPDDIIFVNKGTPGRVCIVPNPLNFCIAQDMVALRANEKEIYPKYLFAALRSSDIQDEIENLHVGSLIPHFKKGDFNLLKIPIPNETTQKFIGDLYYKLSIKIDLLHRQNNTLEQMAETLFRQWFVEEAEESWELVTLGEFISVKHGYAFKGNYISNERTNLILVTPGNFKIGGGFKFDKFKYYTNEDFPKDYIFQNGDLAVTMTDLSVQGDTLGYPALIPNNDLKQLYLHNQRVGKIEFKKEIGKHFIYNLMKTADYQWYILGGASGTAIRHTSPTSICSYSFMMPPIYKLVDFEQYALVLEEKISANQTQIQTLTRLRDSLLPRLMSGEVRVNT